MKVMAVSSRCPIVPWQHPVREAVLTQRDEIHREHDREHVDGAPAVLGLAPDLKFDSVCHLTVSWGAKRTCTRRS
jgi:hypothetical protein